MKNAWSCAVRGGCWLLLFALSPALLAAELEKFDDRQAIEAAQEGLQTRSRFPWYDAQTDQLQPVTVKPEAAPPEVEGWTWQPDKKAKSRFKWNFNGGNFLPQLLQYLAWAVLAIVLIGGVYYITKAMLESEITLNNTDEVLREDELTDAERIENLPFDVRRPQVDLLSEARKAYETGNYNDAIVYLFSYQLVQLDKFHWIRLAKGKTNRQYLREVRGPGELRGLIAATMVTFEDFFFGRHPIDQARFESVWNRLDEFHHLLHPENLVS